MATFNGNAGSVSNNSLVDYFLNIKEAPGESQDHAYKNWIQLQAWQWSEENSGKWGLGQGGGSGKVEMKDFEFHMVTNKASPRLFVLCASGEHIPMAELVCRKAGGGANTQAQKDFLKITFSDCLVSSYKTLGNIPVENRFFRDQDENLILPVDVIKLNFARIIVEYKEQNANGSLGASIRTGYDLKQNIKL